MADTGSDETQYSFNKDILKLLECSVCLKHMINSITQCVNGHSTCENCKSQLTYCPECRGQFSGVRNRLAESIVQYLLIPCENTQVGCSVLSKSVDVDEHRKRCPLRKYKCLFPSDVECAWRGQTTEMVAHFKDVHTIDISLESTSKITWPVQFDEECSKSVLMSRHGEIFYYTMKVVPDTMSAFFCVQFIGPKDNAGNFVYNLEFSSDENKTCKLIFSDSTPDDLKDISSIAESKMCLELSFGIIEYLSGDSKILTCNSTISLNEDHNGAEEPEPPLEEVNEPVPIEIMFFDE